MLEILFKKIHIKPIIKIEAYNNKLTLKTNAIVFLWLNGYNNK
jgi:hypothetical protein